MAVTRAVKKSKAKNLPTKKPSSKAALDKKESKKKDIQPTTAYIYEGFEAFERLQDSTTNEIELVEVQNTTVYTYILKDIIRNIYKIGKTTDPHARFKSLCRAGKVYPIAIVDQDIEAELHERYKANRMFNHEYRYNGGTEWFRSGGVLQELVKKVDTGKRYPFITIHTAITTFFNLGTCKADVSTVWEIEQVKYGYYWIGIEILTMLGYIKYSGGKLIGIDESTVFVIGKKVSISEALITELKSKYIVYIGNSLRSSHIIDNRNKSSRLRRVLLKENNYSGEVFLMLNLVL